MAAQQQRLRTLGEAASAGWWVRRRTGWMCWLEVLTKYGIATEVLNISVRQGRATHRVAPGARTPAQAA